MNKIIDIFLLLALLYCAYTDIKTRKIKNYITFPLMIGGIILNTYLNGIDGLLFSLKGLILAFLVSILFSIFKGFGDGDVKLFMGIGAIKGISFTLDVFVFSLFISIILSVLISPKRFLNSIKNIYNMTKMAIYQVPYTITTKNSAMTVAYALPILMGFILTTIFGGDIIWSILFKN